VGKNVRLAHASDFGHGANRKPFETDLQTQAKRRIDDAGLGFSVPTDLFNGLASGLESHNLLG